MHTISRLVRIALFTLLTSMSAATALAQPAAGSSDTDSPALLAILIVFCLLVVGLLAHTAHRMAKLN
jgi:hypothetical protein